MLIELASNEFEFINNIKMGDSNIPRAERGG